MKLDDFLGVVHPYAKIRIMNIDGSVCLVNCTLSYFYEHIGNIYSTHILNMLVVEVEPFRLRKHISYNEPYCKNNDFEGYTIYIDAIEED